MIDWDKLQKVLGVSFNDLSLLQQALVHRSYANENPDLASTSNERLEFLGDTLLDFVVVEKIYQEFPQSSAGDLTRFRAALVCRQTLANLALSLGLGDYLCLGQGEGTSGGQAKPTNLAGAVEAVIGAVFLDGGLSAARDFTLRLVDSEINKIKDGGVSSDYKSLLQEVIQAEQRLTPTYRVVETTGPDHNKHFIVEVLAGDTILGSGSGQNKRSAEISAAHTALERLNEPRLQE